MLSGPTTRLSFRDLTGRGWAVGALLRPAAVPAFTGAPADLRDGETSVDAVDLHQAVVDAMAATYPDARHAAAADVFSTWLARRATPVSDQGRQANAMADLIDNDPGIRSLDDVSARLHSSPRTLQRLGFTPSAYRREADRTVLAPAACAGVPS